jgi:hypothetical protein
MGRTIPSFRIAAEMERRNWKLFRQALDKSERKTFDEMMSLSIYLYLVIMTITSPDSFKKLSQTGGFGPSLWNRM